MKLSFGKYLVKGFGFVLVLSALSAPAWAVPVPEMDAGLATSAMALLSGGLLMIAGRSRRR
ncbi:MAG: hypothetical protein ACHRXM_23220 [Isosphaerales bacterium]